MLDQCIPHPLKAKATDKASNRARAKKAKAAGAKAKASEAKAKATVEVLKKTKSELSELKEKFRTNGNAFEVSLTMWSTPNSTEPNWFLDSEKVGTQKPSACFALAQGSAPSNFGAEPCVMTKHLDVCWVPMSSESEGLPHGIVGVSLRCPSRSGPVRLECPIEGSQAEQGPSGNGILKPRVPKPDTTH
jgi:hypothetical protein